MAIDWTALRSACRAAVTATWTDVTANGVWPVDRIERVPLDDDNLNLPFATILYGRAEVSGDWGITNQSYLLDITFFYVFRIDLVTEYGEIAAAKGEALEGYLLATGLTTGQVIDMTQQASSQDNDLNMLILDKQKPYYAASVTAQVLIGETNV